MCDDLRDPVALIHKIIRSEYYIPERVLYEDVFQAGYEGYLNAKRNFRAHKYPELTFNFCRPHIKREIRRYLQNQYKHHSNTEVPNLLAEEHFIEKTTPNRISIFNEVLRSEAKEKIIECLNELTPKEKYVIEQLYLSNKEVTHIDVAKRMGVSKQRVTQLKNVALEKLKNLMSH